MKKMNMNKSKYQQALELIVQYAEAFVIANEIDIDYRNVGLQEIKNAKEIIEKVVQDE